MRYLDVSRERDVMEFWLDTKKIAFTTSPNGTSFALDVWEEDSLVGLPFKHSAFFMIETDARFYVVAKYPHAVEKITEADKEVASSSSVTRPTPPHDLRDDDAWRKYREDSLRFRAAISEDAA
jgi:hypothetical protein